MERVRLRRFDAARRSRKVTSRLMGTESSRHRLRRLEWFGEKAEAEKIPEVVKAEKTQQPQTAIEAALALSRAFPQIGVHPEYILEAGKRASTKILPQSPATAWEQARAKAMQATRD